MIYDDYYECVIEVVNFYFIHKEYRAGISFIRQPMEQNVNHIEVIRTGFSHMKTKVDLLALLNLAKQIYYEGHDQIKPFKLNTLTYYANSKLPDKKYREFSVKKKSGGVRTIHAPVKGLKTIQRVLNFVLQCVFTPHPLTTGFVPDKSIVDNASAHAGNNYVFNTDLKDFFPSIELHRVKACFKLPPFNLSGEREPLAFLLANLCCVQLEVERMNGNQWEKKTLPVLPQGAPTSPTITNIVCQTLDHKLTGLAKRFNLNYTRYADDITFSSMHNVYQNNSLFLGELIRIIESQNFHINPLKTRLQKRGFRQEATGLVVNERVNVKRRYVKQIRNWLYLWETYGYNYAEQKFINDYVSDKGHTGKQKPNMINVLSGKLEFLRMVRGNNDNQYIKLQKRLMKLINKEQGIPPLTEIINVWEKEGIEKAIEISNLIKE